MKQIRQEHKATSDSSLIQPNCYETSIDQYDLDAKNLTFLCTKNGAWVNASHNNLIEQKCI